ncbi:heat shock protein STI-like [Trifolium medium]|uniref:Heat shock protein STI-like n=1 Tax=Trifolium medium TaxID=97028 RepID=A0A392N0K4_9FABA|nr:heat shock protein STI-like [Trifolium medium]
MKTAELKPDWSKGYSRLGAAHIGLSQFDDAFSAYKKGLEIDPNNEPLKSACKKKDSDTAIQDYSKAVEFDDQDVSFLINRAAVYLEMGKLSLV